MSEEFMLILGKLDKIDGRMEHLEDEVGGLRKDMTEVKGEIVELKSDMAEVKEDIVELKSDVVEVKKDIVELKTDVKKLNGRVDSLETKVTGIQMTLENDTNKYIRIIAEGHLELSRKLDEALKIDTQKEMLLLRVACLEKDVRELKEQSTKTA